MEIVPYRADHLRGVRIRDLSEELREQVMSDEYLSLLEHVGPGFTGVIDGEVIGSIVFCMSKWPGVAEALALFPEDIARYGRMLHRVCKRSIEGVQNSYGIRRMECRIAISATRNRRWVESLGFVPEGVSRAFGPSGEDYIYYGRVTQCHL